MTKSKSGSKKAALLYILDILKTKSGSTGMDQSDIIDELGFAYGIKLNRETVGRNLDILLDLYPDNITFRLNNAQKRCGWRWIDTTQSNFDSSEVRLLLGVVECYGKLDIRHKQDLMDRIADLDDGVNADRLFCASPIRSKRDDTYRLFYNIGTLGEAIAKGRRVSFSRGVYKEDGEIVRAEGADARSYTVKPKSIAFKNNTYMLIATFGDSDNERIMHHAIDTMFDIMIVPQESDASQSSSLNENFGFDIQKYLDEHLYMYTQNPQRTVIRIWNNPTCIRQMYEQFGLGVKGTRPCANDDQIDFIVNEPETPMVFWALQYSDMAEILEPESLRSLIADQAKLLEEKYCHA